MVTSEPLKLMCVIAHPDDESLGAGPVLAKYAAEGVVCAVVCATRGERGWVGDPQAHPGFTVLGARREAELRAAAEVLGVKHLALLGYMDGELDEAEARVIIPQLVAELRSFRPQVVLTFDPFGAYGHPDHIAICQFTTAAITAAASDTFEADGAPHTVSKLYYMADTEELLRKLRSAVGEIEFIVKGEKRHAAVWAPWSISTTIEAPEQRDIVWRAITCHVSQAHEYEPMLVLPEADLRYLASTRTFYRAFSLVNTAPGMERDFFEGLRGN